VREGEFGVLAHPFIAVGKPEDQERFCRQFWMKTERGQFHPKTLCSQDVELLGEG
jgi:hypothetical protein